MQKWEYLIVEIDGVFSIATVYRVNGEHPKEQPRFIKYLPELGNQGWELIAVRDDFFFFKRPAS